MWRILDKMILLVPGAILLSQIDAIYRPVIVFLIALATCALGLYLNQKKQIAILLAVFLGVCIFIPELTFFLPVVFYDAIRYDLKIGIGAIAVLFLYGLFNDHGWGLVLLLLTFIISAVLEIRMSKMERLEEKFIHFRDTSTERNLVLEEKNKDLMEKQDYEIYLATLKERNRIAREIHDHVGHMLSRSLLQVGALLAVNKDEQVQQQLNSVKDTLNLAMTNIRESVHDLHDDSIDLKQAVLDATQQMNEQYELTIDYDMTPAVSRKVKYCFISIIKEAMSNIVKHSNATKISIIVREHPGFYQLEIEDNGVVDNPSLEGGIGIENMRARSEALNGSFRIYTEKGFKIFVSIRKQEE